MTLKAEKNNKNELKQLQVKKYQKPYKLLLDFSFINAFEKLNFTSIKFLKLLKHYPKISVSSCDYELLKTNNSLISDECEILKCPLKKKHEPNECIKSVYFSKYLSSHIFCTLDLEIINNIKKKPIIMLQNTKLVLKSSNIKKQKNFINLGKHASQEEIQSLKNKFSIE